MATIIPYTAEWSEMLQVLHFAFEQMYPQKQIKHVILSSSFDSNTSHFRITCALHENGTETYGRIIMFEILKINQQITSSPTTMFSMRKHFNTNKYVVGRVQYISV
jgi:predicted ATPase